MLLTKEDVGKKFLTRGGLSVCAIRWMGDIEYPMVLQYPNGDAFTTNIHGIYSSTQAEHYLDLVRCMEPETTPKSAATTTKDSNPKDVVGVRKVPFSCLSMPVMAEVAVAMLEGARKYGRHNYRKTKVSASVYIDASGRHISSFFEGEDTDPDSGINHIPKAIASLMVLRDAQMRGQMIDDRPPGTAGFIKKLNDKASEIINRYPEAIEPFLAEGPPVEAQI